MPRRGPRRPLIAIRISDEGREHIDRRAKEEGANRSEMVRRMLAYAAVHMPAGWRPAPDVDTPTTGV